jgi:hypothetical protein
MFKKLSKLFKSKWVKSPLFPWVKKTFTLVLIATLMLGFSPAVTGIPAISQPVLEAPEGAPIAPIDSSVNIEVAAAEADNRALKLAAYLETKRSPLSEFAANLVVTADKYSLDWRLLSAISGVESGYAKIYVRGTYNAWGWGGGYIGLGSWDNAIEVISKALKEKYGDKWGAKTPEAIGRYWAEDPNWAYKVNLHLGMIDEFVSR